MGSFAKTHYAVAIVIGVVILLTLCQDVFDVYAKVSPLKDVRELKFFVPPIIDNIGSDDLKDPRHQLLSQMAPISVESVNISAASGTKQLCPPTPPHLVGRLKILKDAYDWNSLEQLHPGVRPGGRFSPPDCEARQRVAIVIPYRDREEHLKTFLHHIHPIMMRQQLDYGIFAVNQTDSLPFNRATLFNIGYLEASRSYPWDCFIFHDVDLLPEDDRNMYKCENKPKHMSVAVDTMHYKLPYPTLFGGVVAISKKDFIQLNGFSNQYWGWGAEDDDMANRISHHGMEIKRKSAEICRYTMIKHVKATPGPKNSKMLRTTAKAYFELDGLNNLNYTLLNKVSNKLYTEVNVVLRKVKPLEKPHAETVINFKSVGP